LAAHAQQIGAAVVSATCPSYFKIGSVELLVECMAEVANGAPELPFYYYHIPALTGAQLDMVEFLTLAGGRIANLAGLKYTAPALYEYQACLERDNQRFDVLWGADEMLLGALSVGARGAVGSTYNIAAPLYRGIMQAFQRGALDEARQQQLRAVRMVRLLQHYPFHPAMKAVLRMLGVDCGPCRLPHPRLHSGQLDTLRRELEMLGFFDWRK
jgi:N-acetylneuraminate lyase